MARQTIPMRGDLAAAVGTQALPSKLTIRLFDPGDEAALGQLMFSAYRAGVDDHGETLAWHTAEARRTIAGDFGQIIRDASFIARSGRELVAVCLVTDERTHLLLAFALVRPDWQGQGVGSVLIARSARALLAGGHQEWTLAVTDDNPAQHLYARMGFVVDESLRGN